MAFPKKYLNDGEEIIIDLRPHWFFLFGPSAALVAALALGIWVASTDDPPEWLVFPVAGLAVVALLFFLVRLAQWMTTDFVLTTDRLIYRKGIVSRTGREIPLERINDVSFNQSLFQRMLRAGDLLVESGGERGQSSFGHFADPQGIQNEIHRAIEAAAARDADRMAGRRELSPLEQLEKLEELRQRGVISQAEFDIKKQKLLDRL
ncbi:MAG TPA: PH domain-containing protein [Acidimicrobiales bacterium]|nr:PH domain-containing protein [Acidimicrobiales bacterium]